MIFNFPDHRLSEFDGANVYLKGVKDPIVINGQVINANDDGGELIIETASQFASFACCEVAGVHLFQN